MRCAQLISFVEKDEIFKAAVLPIVTMQFISFLELVAQQCA
jgi:hypothetical protein